jgi:hypothetical protein
MQELPHPANFLLETSQEVWGDGFWEVQFENFPLVALAIFNLPHLNKQQPRQRQQQDVL